MPRPLLAALAIGAALLFSAGTAHAEPVPDGYAYTDEWFESFDGTQMHAGVFLPADHRPGERHPVILTLTPYAAPNGGATAAGNASGPVIRFPELFTDAKILEDRWAYVQVDVRGFGGSGGCFEYYGANEAKDAARTVEWAADAPWSAGKVAMWGKSYDAATEVLAMAGKPTHGLAATVIQAPGLSGYTGLWMNRVHYATGRYLTTGAYTADDLGPAHNVDSLTSPQYATAFADGLLQPPACRIDAIAGMNTERDRDSTFWRGREPYLDARGSAVPTLWSHGFFDANTKPVHLDVWTSLTGPREAWFGQYDHIRGHEPGVGRRGFLEQAMRFLDRHVRGVASDAADAPVTIQRGDGNGVWRAEESWPPADVRPWSMPLRPGAYADAPGNEGDGSGAGNGLWTVSAPLPHPAHMAGEARVRATIDAPVVNVNVVSHLYDIAPDGTATLVNRGAKAAPGAGEQVVEYALYPNDWRFASGHRIGLVLSGADDSWFAPGTSLGDVAVSGGTLTLPLLRYERTATLEGGPSVSQEEDAPFAVDAATLAGGVVESGAPPAMEPMPAGGPGAPPGSGGSAGAGAAGPGGHRPPPAPSPTGSPPGSSPAGTDAARRPFVRLTLRRLTRGRRRVSVSGRTATTAGTARLTLRFGGIRLAVRTVRVSRRTGAFRATFVVNRLRRGRLSVTVAPKRAGGAMRASRVLR